MDSEKLKKVLEALETFDRAAQAHGWHNSDESGRVTAYRAKRLYRAAKTRLVALLQDTADEKS